MTSKELMAVGCATLAFACGGANKEPATAASETSSGVSEAAASQGAGGGIKYEGGDGSSCKQAIAIVGAQGEQDGVASEYSFINRHYPGAKIGGQSLIDCSGAAADRMEIQTADGRNLVLFFDVSRFFGKL